MGAVGAALGVQHIGLAQGAIGGELTGAAIDEGAARHHQLAGVAGHRCRHRIEVAAHRRTGLESAAHRLERFGVADPHRLDHITAQRPQAGVHGITEPSEHRRHQVAAQQRFANHLRCQKQALEQQAVQVEAGAALTADARCRKPAAGLLHQLSTASHITAGGGDRAAQVLDQRAGHQIHPQGGGLLQLHQFAVAVIHEHHAIRLDRLDPLHQPADPLHTQRRPPAVPAAALDQHHPRRHRQGRGDGGLIHSAIGQQVELVVNDAELRQGTLAAAADADHLLQGVVRATGEGQQAIPGTQHAKQGCSNGVGAAHELQPHGGGLGLQHPCKHPIEHLTAQIAMAVAAHRGEVVHPQALGRERRQDPLQPRLHTGTAHLGQGLAAHQGSRQLIGSPGGMGRGGHGRGAGRQGAAFMLPRGSGHPPD